MTAQLILSSILVLSACSSTSDAGGPPWTEGAGGIRATVFLPELVPEGMLVHGGCFSPGQTEFMFTVSDAAFQRFDVKTIRRVGDGWSSPRNAFFNSSANEHGTSFSPDGKTLYFSSTRPVHNTTTVSTWQLWRCQRTGEEWGMPTHVDIPNLRDALVSHPSVATDGTLYFHAGAPDYSELQIYSARPDGNRFGDASRLPAEINRGLQQYTPFIDPERRFLLFEDQSGLMVSFRDSEGTWSRAVALGEQAPTQTRGNPYITPDGRFLFFAAGDDPNSADGFPWTLYRVSTAGLNLPSPSSPQ